MIPQNPAIGFFIQYPNMILYMLCCDIQCNFGQIQICSNPGSRSNPGMFKNIFHDPYTQFLCRHLIHCQIIRYIHKHFIDTVNMDVFFGNVFQINRINLCRIINIKLHPWWSHDIFDPFGYFKNPTSPWYSQFFHCRGNCKTDSFI